MNISERLAKPKWQRAKIIKTPTIRQFRVVPELIGRIIYVRTEPPQYHWTIDGYSVECNLRLIETADFAEPAYITSDIIERLARGPEDFCDDPPLLTWEEFLAQGATDDPAR
jgi:hypothetical protein